jgi:hypothetical protein
MIATDVVIADELTRILNESHAAARTERRLESAKFQRELDDINTDENRLVDLLMARTLDEPSYKAQVQRIGIGVTRRPESWPWRARTWTTPTSRRSQHFRTREVSQNYVGRAIGGRSAAVSRDCDFERAPRWPNCSI